MSAGLVLIGGSYAAVNIAIGAREAGYEGPIRLVSAETHLPYQRPPLSKAYLHGKQDEAALAIRAEAFYRQQQIELLLGRPAVSIDRAGRSLRLDDGTVLAYDRLALATGARARRLAVTGAGLAGVLYLRSLDDARMLSARLAAARRVVVIGGGFVGLEAAASAMQLGKEVTVLESQDRLLARALAAPLAQFLAGAHRRRGVALEFGAQVAALESDLGRVAAVRMADGRSLAADLVIVGIGSIPNVELAEAAGLTCRDGILVDRMGRTDDPAIFAAGDCTRHPSRFGGGQLRLESVQNAAEQGRAVGANMAGRQIAYDAVPWFWSDQFDLKLQMAGLAAGCDRTVRRGEAEGERFSLFHYRNDRLVAVESVNRPAEHMLARKLLAADCHPAPAMAADPAADLRALLIEPAQAV
jgi:3-phenylpropionate/trans-cinnamate dioxygenase ferredoxin reductase subunit